MLFLRCLFTIIVLVACFQSAVFASERVIKLATLQWEPYVGEKLDNYGFTSEIVTKAFKKAGYGVEIFFMPWIRVLAEVKTGEYDAMYPAYYSDERSRIYALSRPIADGPLVFCKRCDKSIPYKSLLDLKPYTIGVVRGYVNTPEFDAANYLHKKMVNSDKQNLLKLWTERIDLAVIDKFTAKQIINTSLPQAAGKLCFLDPPLEIKPLYVGFSKAIANYPKLLKNFNQILDELKESGMIDRIIKKHNF